MVMIIAYSQGPTDSGGKFCENHCWIAVFHARAAIRPKAAVISADVFSIISSFTLRFPPYGIN
jgi:hypothetical protein